MATTSSAPSVPQEPDKSTSEPDGVNSQSPGINADRHRDSDPPSVYPSADTVEQKQQRPSRRRRHDVERSTDYAYPQYAPAPASDSARWGSGDDHGISVTPGGPLGEPEVASQWQSPLAPDTTNGEAGRRLALEATGSRQPEYVVAAVKDAVVDKVMTVPYVTRLSDKQMYGRLLDFAVHVYGAKGTFDPAADLTDTAIADFVTATYPNAATGTPGTVASVLFRIKNGPPRPVARKRETVEAYTDDEWEAFWGAAHGAGRHGLDARVLLTLTGELGLHASEVNHARADWLLEENNSRRWVLRVPDGNGEFRDIPLNKFDAQVLNEAKAAHANPDDYLLSPSVRSGRKNVTTRLPRYIAKSYKVFGDFYAGRARNYWLARLMSKPIPFTHVMYLASNKTSVTPVQVAARMPAPSPDELRRSMRGAGLL